MEYLFNILFLIIFEIKDIILSFWFTKKLARAFGITLNVENNRFLFINEERENLSPIVPAIEENVLSAIIPTIEENINLSAIIPNIEFIEHLEDIDLDLFICDIIGIEDQSKNKLNVIKFEPDSEDTENKSYYGVSKEKLHCANIEEEPYYAVIKEESRSSDSNKSFVTAPLKKDDEMWMFNNEVADCEDKFCAKDEEIDDMVSDTYMSTLPEDPKISQIEDGGNIKYPITSTLKVKLRRLTSISTSMIKQKKGRYNLRPRNCDLSYFEEQNGKTEIINGKVYRKYVNEVGYLMSEENKKLKKIAPVNSGNTLDLDSSPVKDLCFPSTRGSVKNKARKLKKSTRTTRKSKVLRRNTSSIVPYNRRYSRRSKIQAKKAIRKYRGKKTNRKWKRLENLTPSKVKLVIKANKRKFSCSACKYSSNNEKLAILHIQRHLGYKPFKCCECDYAGASKSNHDSHMK